jgi:hypothetical protein
VVTTSLEAAMQQAYEVFFFVAKKNVSSVALWWEMSDTSLTKQAADY